MSSQDDMDEPPEEHHPEEHQSTAGDPQPVESQPTEPPLDEPAPGSAHSIQQPTEPLLSETAAGSGGQPPPPPPPPPSRQPGPEPRRGSWMSGLHRSSRDRMIAGVAGGLAESTGIPPLIVRLLFVVSATFLVGLVIYAIAWAVLPDETQLQVDGPEAGSTNHIAGRLLVTAGIALAVIALPLGRVLAASVSRLAFPAILILIGLAMIGRNREGTGATATRPMASTRATPPTVPPPTTPPPDATTVHPPGMSIPGPDSATQTIPYPSTSPTTQPNTPLDTAMTAPLPPTIRRQRPVLRFPYIGLLTWSTVLVILGAIAATAVLGGPVVGPGSAVALALIMFSAGLILSAFRGRARGLILPILTLVALLGMLAVMNVRVDNLNGPFDVAATTSDELPDQLHSAAGISTLQLTRLALTEDRTLRVRVDFGTLRVDLPLDTTVVIKGRIGMGGAQIYRYDRSSTAAYSGIQKQWIADGVPAAGSPIDPSILDDHPDIAHWLDNLEPAGVNGREGLTVTVDRTFDRGSNHVLTLEIEMGIGEIELVDPVWGSEWWEPSEATQLCTIANGPIGPCGDLDEELRFPLCINEIGYLVDCRTDRPGTQDSPRIAACRDMHDNEVDCAELGIDPIGAKLIGPTEDVPPIDVESETGSTPPTATGSTPQTETEPWKIEPDMSGTPATDTWATEAETEGDD